MMGQSFVPTATGRRIGEAPVYGYSRSPDLPPVGVTHREQPTVPPRPLPHAHDFLVLGFIVGGEIRVLLDGRSWRLQPGDLFLVAPGEVIDTDPTVSSQGAAETWTVYFPPDAIEPGALSGWHAHPLLAPFIRSGGGIQRLPVAEQERSRISAHYQNLDRELRLRPEGFGDAVLAHLTLLLVEVVRLAADVPGGLRRRDEPLLAEVFEMIESRFAEPISLREVAAVVSVSPAHLTTVVGRKTGRTVGQWITERRMLEARQLLVGTEMTVATVAGRVGFADPGYFNRIFRREHGVTPLQWRRARMPGQRSAEM